MRESSRPPWSADDVASMRRALRLAARGAATVAPNPRVGAVVVSAEGKRVGEAWHRRAGEPHAEPLALAAAGAAARGSTVYVTLEPCAHHGRKPPCVEALVAAGVRRVVAAHRDPDPRTAGEGIARLRAAGMRVDVGLAADDAIEVNLPFLVSRVMRRPAVTLKWAASLDGKIATASGESRWVTGEAARRRGLELREEHDAILVGSGTALADDPRLTRRLGRADGPILRVVIDRRLRLPPTARMLAEPGPALVYTESSDARRIAALRAGGAEISTLPSVDPAAVLADLHARGVQSVLVEGGGRVAGAFFAADLWDRVVTFVAPRLIGGVDAPTAIAGEGVTELAQAAALARVRMRRRGADFELMGMRTECLRELSSSVAD